VGTEQMDAEIVQTVAGVLRLLRRADEAAGLLPRRPRLDAATPVGDNPAELLASAEQLLGQISVEGAPARLLGLKALVAELVWEANTGSARDRRTVGELSPILMRSRETCCLM
jgi:hypothetical protein